MDSSLPKVQRTSSGQTRNLACGKLGWSIYQGGIYSSTGDAIEVRRRRGNTRRPPKVTLRRSSQNVESAARFYGTGTENPGGLVNP